VLFKVLRSNSTLSHKHGALVEDYVNNLGTGKAEILVRGNTSRVLYSEMHSMLFPEHFNCRKFQTKEKSIGEGEPGDPALFTVFFHLNC